MSRGNGFVFINAIKPEYISNFTSKLMGDCIYKQYNLKRT